MAQGYAIVDADGEIDLKTLYDTERGVKVNWLIGKGFLPLQHHPDDLIDFLFKAHCNGARVLPVTIEVARKT